MGWLPGLASIWQTYIRMMIALSDIVGSHLEMNPHRELVLLIARAPRMDGWMSSDIF